MISVDNLKILGLVEDRGLLVHPYSYDVRSHSEVGNE